MSEYCQMCEAIGPEGKGLLENTIILETDNFVVIPTLGQFIEGWLMVVSKEHVPSAQSMSPYLLTELSEVVQQTGHMLEAAYGQCVVFEHGHGPSLHRAAGCCVAHTHLHVAPCRSSSRFASLIPFGPSSRLRLPELPQLARTGYLLVTDAGQNGEYDLYEIQTVIPRQFLRQVLAASEGCEEVWDWRRYPCHENIRSTIERLGAELVSMGGAFQPLLAPLHHSR